VRKKVELITDLSSRFDKVSQTFWKKNSILFNTPSSGLQQNPFMLRRKQNFGQSVSKPGNYLRANLGQYRLIKSYGFGVFGLTGQSAPLQSPSEQIKNSFLSTGCHHFSNVPK